VLGDLPLRILSTSLLEQAHYYRGEYKRVIELATDNLAALPGDRLYESFGNFVPASVFDRFWLVLSLAELGKFAQAAEDEAQAIRLAESMQHASSVSLAYYAASMLHLFAGDWAKARSLLEHDIAVTQAGNVMLILPLAVAASAWPWRSSGRRARQRAGFGQAKSSLNGMPRGDTSAISRWPATRWVAPVYCSVGSLRRAAWVTVRSKPLRVTPGSRPVRCTCSPTSPSIPTGSIPRAARPTTDRRWRSPSRAACARSSRTVTSA